MKTFDKICKLMDRLAGIVTVALMIFISVMITASVIFRLFGHPIQWSYEATLLCMSYTIFIGMIVTFARDENMRLTFVANALKPKARNILLAVLDGLVLAFLVWAAYLSIGVIETSWATYYQTIPFTRGLFYLPFPIGCVCSACQIINVNYKRLTGQSAPAAEE